MSRVVNPAISKSTETRKLNFIETGDVTKLSKSCDFCKSKKVKCDQVKPICSYCVRHSQECVYSRVRKPGLRPGYGQQVFDRINGLESFVENFHTSSSTEIESLKNRIEEFTSRFESIEDKLINIGNANITKISATGEATNNVNANDNVIVNGTVNNGFANVNPSSSISNKETIDMNSIDNIISSTSTASGNQEGKYLYGELPTIHEATILLDIFQEKIHPIFPVVEHSKFNTLLEEYETAPRSILLGAILCSLRFADTSLITHRQKKVYHESIFSRLLNSCFVVGTVEELQAMSLLAFDLYSYSNNPKTWSVISLIASGVVHLNLSRGRLQTSILELYTSRSGVSKNVTSRTVASQKVVEERKLLFWEIFQLDILSSASSSFPLKIPSSEIDCSLPLKRELFESAQTNEDYERLKSLPTRTLNKYVSNVNYDHYDSNCFLIEILNILGKIHMFMRKPLDLTNIKEMLNWQIKFSELDNEIQVWKATLPRMFNDLLDNEKLPYDKINSYKDILFHSLYYTTIVRLNSSVGYPYLQLSSGPLSFKDARSRCLDAAQHVVNFAKKLSQIFEDDAAFHQRIGPYYAFSLWVSARLLLVNAINSDLEIPADVQYLISLLTRMGDSWESASKYANILNFLISELETESQENLNIINHFSHGGSEESMYRSEDASIISDMRLNAYNLDVILSEKVEKFTNRKGGKVSPNNQADISNFFEWFKLPFTEINTPTLQ